MCKTCGTFGLVSVAATWGFFAVLLSVLGAVKPLVNSIWLTLLIFAATITCPAINPYIQEHCTCEVKPKKKKKR